MRTTDSQGLTDSQRRRSALPPRWHFRRQGNDLFVSLRNKVAWFIRHETPQRSIIRYRVALRAINTPMERNTPNYSWALEHLNKYPPLPPKQPPPLPPHPPPHFWEASFHCFEYQSKGKVATTAINVQWRNDMGLLLLRFLRLLRLLRQRSIYLQINDTNSIHGSVWQSRWLSPAAQY